MKVKVAKHIGFCFGVKRAVNIAEQALNKNGRFFCLGAIIHNPQEVKRLSEKGLRIIDDISCLEKTDTLIIRSHGLLPDLIDAAIASGAKLIDATCPFVKKAQELCKTLSEERFDVVVIGDRYHPEVKALVGFVNSGRGEAFVVENMSDIKKIKFKNKKIGIVAQTTQSKKNFQELVKVVLKKYTGKSGFDQIKIFNTICKDSAKRQEAARRISSACDIMFVIGGRNSANSRRLANICKEAGKRTYHVETAADIKPKYVEKYDRVGIVSGASTPDWIIEAVVKRLKIIEERGMSFATTKSGHGI